MAQLVEQVGGAVDVGGGPEILRGDLLAGRALLTWMSVSTEPVTNWRMACSASAASWAPRPAVVSSRTSTRRTGWKSSAVRPWACTTATSSGCSRSRRRQARHTDWMRVAGSSPLTVDRGERRDDAVDHRVEQRRLVADVPVDGGDGDAELAGEAPHREGGQPLGLHDGEGRGDDVVGAQGGAGGRVAGLGHLTRGPGHATMLHEQRYRAEVLAGKAPVTTEDRYIVMSADGHAGNEMHAYRDYLERRYLDDFDAWAAEYRVPYPDLEGPDASRNWDSDRRLAETRSRRHRRRGAVPQHRAALLSRSPRSRRARRPRTPPSSSCAGPASSAHNRWLVDFCAAAPGRRAGIAQILLPTSTPRSTRFAGRADAGLTGGVLLPGAPPGTGLPPLYSPGYEPIWSVCEELGMPVNHHTGSAVPPLGDAAVDNVVFLLEVTWWAHRVALAPHLRRRPRAPPRPAARASPSRAPAWIPEKLRRLDYFFDRMGSATGTQEMEWGRAVVGHLSLRPSEYWARQCHVGSSFLRPGEVAHAPRDRRRPDHVGQRLPAPRVELPVLARGAPALVRPGRRGRGPAPWSAATPPPSTGSTSTRCGPLAARVGPTVTEVARPLARRGHPRRGPALPSVRRPASVH